MAITQNNICIIPARGGSKRIPKKNVKNFLGKPIIAYSIEAALKSGLFSEVMVSTDDFEIAEIAKSYGAKVPFYRTELLSDDYTPLRDVFLEVLREYHKRGFAFLNFCGILPTAPLLTSEDLKRSYSLLGTDAKAVMSVVEYDFPIERFLREKDGFLSIGDTDSYRKRSQDFPLNYHDAGQFYWANVEGYESLGSFFSLNAKAYKLNLNKAVDIDTMEDWEKAEIIYKYFNDH